FAGCKGLTSIDIPSNVTSIGYRAFDNCSDLTSVKIPSGITSIDEGAFKHCSSLTSVKIPSGIESVGRETFYGCKSLTSVEIPSGITKISSAAFALCGNLMEITIPSSVTEIESLAFVGCRALTIYCETATQPIGWVSGWKGNNPVVWNSESNEIAEDGYIYFVAENGIRYALKDGIAKITDQSELIGGNKEIPTSISYKDIEYSVTSIEDSAFLNCNNLMEIIIPTSVSTINIYAFKGCLNLTVYCEAASIPSGWDSLWDNGDCKVVWGYKKN
ncbi:MAG: leucine-rich repeat domain-containing protein, partial [Clostridia bacterium]|nr:leucine-rich repeat domain-containing protein [Clostridia bacterium]